MSHFVYMLRCKGNRIYTGYAVDVEARFKHHAEGKGARFTKAFPPECILKTFELATKELALRLEARIKKMKRLDKELLAAGDEQLWQKLESSLSELLVKKKKKRWKKPAEKG